MQSGLVLARWRFFLCCSGSAGIGPILYVGLLSVGLAYTLQVIAQRTADPSHAAVILSLEGAFAALGGWFVLSESLTLRGLLGGGLMLAGTLVSQFIGSSSRAVPSFERN